MEKTGSIFGLTNWMELWLYNSYINSSIFCHPFSVRTDAIVNIQPVEVEEIRP